MNRFLNRMLMVPYAMQETLFEVLYGILSAMRQQDQKNGRMIDEGLQPIARGLRTHEVSRESFEPLPLPGGQLAFTTLRVDRGRGNWTAIVLTGDGILRYWATIEEALECRARVVRAQTSCGALVVGIRIPPRRMSVLRTSLETAALT